MEMAAQKPCNWQRNNSIMPTAQVEPSVVATKLEADSQIEQEMQNIVKQSVQMPIKLNDETTDNIDKVLLHPIFGLPLFFLAMFLLFQFIFTAGKPLQDGMAWLLNGVRTGALEPLLAGLPDWLNGLLLDGIFNGISTVAAFCADHCLIFLGHEHGRRQWLPLSRRIFNGCTHGKNRPRRSRLCDGADGFWL